MPKETLQIEVVGLDKLLEAFEKFPNKVIKNMETAGQKSATIILETEGIGTNYPPETRANKPPYPYYERGKGTWTSAGTNRYNSEIMGKRWVIKSKKMSTSIGNIASYAAYVHGDRRFDKVGQARAMKRIGWRKLIDVAKEKLSKIQVVYQRWVDKTLRDVNLK